jgi:hypothetical protein
VAVADETVVPDGIALGFVKSPIGTPATIEAGTLAKFRTLLPAAVALLVALTHVSVTSASVPVLKAVAVVILVFKASVLVVVAALVVFETPE